MSTILVFGNHHPFTTSSYSPLGLAFFTSWAIRPMPTCTSGILSFCLPLLTCVSSLTPYDAEPTKRHANYNFAHSSTRMTIERCFGKFKAQWKLFASTLPRYYPEEIGKFLQAGFVMHNVTINVDQDIDSSFSDDPHLGRIIDDDLSRQELRRINNLTGNAAEKLSKTEAKRIRNTVKDYLEMYIR